MARVFPCCSSQLLTSAALAPATGAAVGSCMRITTAAAAAAAAMAPNPSPLAAAHPLSGAGCRCAGRCPPLPPLPLSGVGCRCADRFSPPPPPAPPAPAPRGQSHRAELAGSRAAWGRPARSGRTSGVRREWGHPGPPRSGRAGSPRRRRPAHVHGRQGLEAGDVLFVGGKGSTGSKPLPGCIALTWKPLLVWGNAQRSMHHGHKLGDSRSALEMRGCPAPNISKQVQPAGQDFQCASRDPHLEQCLQQAALVL